MAKTLYEVNDHDTIGVGGKRLKAFTFPAWVAAHVIVLVKGTIAKTGVADGTDITGTGLLGAFKNLKLTQSRFSHLDIDRNTALKRLIDTSSGSSSNKGRQYFPPVLSNQEFYAYFTLTGAFDLASLSKQGMAQLVIDMDDLANHLDGTAAQLSGNLSVSVCLVGATRNRVPIAIQSEYSESGKVHHIPVQDEARLVAAHFTLNPAVDLKEIDFGDEYDVEEPLFLHILYNIIEEQDAQASPTRFVAPGLTSKAGAFKEIKVTAAAATELEAELMYAVG